MMKYSYFLPLCMVLMLAGCSNRKATPLPQHAITPPDTRSILLEPTMPPVTSQIAPREPLAQLPLVNVDIRQRRPRRGNRTSPGLTAIDSAPAVKSAPPAASSSQSPTETAASASGSILGQLTGAESPDTERKMRQAQEDIASTELKVNALKRTFSTSEQETLAQIKNYLRQAHHSLDLGDADGAETLASKAKVLLAEITQ